MEMGEYNFYWRFEKANELTNKIKYEEADESYRNLIPTVERTLGPGHRNTLTIKLIYARTLHGLKKFEEASII